MNAEHAEKASLQLKLITEANTNICDMTVQTAGAVEEQHAMSNEVIQHSDNIGGLINKSAQAAQASHDQAIQLKRESITLQEQISLAFKLNI